MSGSITSNKHERNTIKSPRCLEVASSLSGEVKVIELWFSSSKVKVPRAYSSCAVEVISG